MEPMSDEELKLRLEINRLNKELKSGGVVISEKALANAMVITVLLSVISSMSVVLTLGLLNGLLMFISSWF